MIRGKNFNIRHVKKSDLCSLLPLLSDTQLRGDFLPSGIVSPAELEQRFDKDGFSSEAFERLLIVDHSDQILGTLFHFKSVPYFNAREIGYTLLDPDQRNNGITTQAVKMLTRYLFNALLINRLEIRMDSRNLASEKVAIRNGFKLEGIARGASFVGGRHVDMKVYALLREEFQAGDTAQHP